MTHGADQVPHPLPSHGAGIATLVDTHRADAVRIAIAVLGDADAADDVAQEVMIRLVAAWPGFDPAADLKGWVYRVTLNRCRDQLRRGRRLSGGVAPEDAPPDPALTTASSPDRELDLASARAAVGTAMSRLSSEHQEVLHMRYMEGLAFADIARLTAIPQGTVASRVFRALKLLAAQLDRRHLEVLE